jgi:hypothetical protein
MVAANNETAVILLVIPAKAGIQLLVLHFPREKKQQRHWITRRVPRLALRAIRFANVRFGILPSQSGLRRNDAQESPPSSLFPLPVF